MRKVLFVYPPWKPPGGSNAVAVWMIEALKGACELTVLAGAAPDWDAANRAYGTTLAPGDVRLELPGPAGRAVFARPGRWLLKHHVLLRAARRLAPGFDVVVSANDESDFGRPGIQYVHYPRFDDPRVNPRAARPLESHDVRWYHRQDLLVRAYFRACAAVSGFTLEGTRRNLTLVNSEWTARRVREVLGVEPVVVYPPVPSDFPDVPWAEREPAFVCIGRVAAEKRTDVMIDILRRVRARGHDVRLTVVGVMEHPAYLARIRAQIADLGPFVTLTGELPRAELARTVARHRFGLHGMAREHFGIAVAELVNAGCIPFVPDDGGQVEIVGGEPELLWRTPDEAAAKIDAVLRAPARQDALRAHLAARRGSFSPETFMARVRDVVASFQPPR